MTSIPPKVLNADRLGDQYLLTVRVGDKRYSGEFNGLNSETMSRTADRIDMDGLTLPICKTPAANLVNHSRDRPFSSRQPALYLVVGS